MTVLRHTWHSRHAGLQHSSHLKVQFSAGWCGHSDAQALGPELDHMQVQGGADQ
jgi:hypothetical protein